jgi:glucose/arabinose dehydrogenase
MRPARPSTLRWAGASATAAAMLLAGCGADTPDAIAPGPSATFATTAPTITPTPAPAPSDTTAVPDSSPTTAAVATTAAPPSSEPAGDPEVTLVSIGTFDRPVDLAWRSGDATIYIVEQAGTVTPWRDGTSGDPVLDISELTAADGEKGLLGLAFSPDGSRAYINHTDRAGDTVIAEYAVAADGRFDAATRRVLLTVDQPYGNHNGGNVTIGPDGMLYIGMGDGGAADDPQRFSLNLTSLLGKILRIDPAPSPSAPYTVPADNPFVDVDGARPEIWSVGLRNPWRLSFDRDTGDLWVADVGQNELEEINLSRAADGAGRGVNFGWSAFEGTRRYNEDQPSTGATPPVLEYEHGENGCSVSGGAVYRGEAIPELRGWYVFSDFCSGHVTGLRVDGARAAEARRLAQAASVTAVREGPGGTLYVLSITGDIARIVAA